jgi:hypothetical protein
MYILVLNCSALSKIQTTVSAFIVKKITYVLITVGKKVMEDVYCKITKMVIDAKYFIYILIYLLHTIGECAFISRYTVH